MLRCLASFRGSVDELAFSGFGVVKAAHGIELAEVECENDHVGCVLWVWGRNIVTVVVSATQDHGFESPDCIRMAPTLNPGLS